MSEGAHLGWRHVLRLALVQTAIGAIIVLATSTLNRIMIIELALPALIPGALVASHYLIQLLRLHHGYRVDRAGHPGGRILGGMAILAAGGFAAALATAWMGTDRSAGLVLAAIAYLAIGVGVGAAGTANLALLSKHVDPKRRPLVAALVWIMMIAGFSLSAGLAGHFLQPFSALRLVLVFAVACGLAVLLAWLAVSGLPRTLMAAAAPAGSRADTDGFAAALRRLWSDPAARCFTTFLFLSMLAFSAQELLLEPFAGLVFALPPGATARLSGLQNAGVLSGMLALVLTGLGNRRAGKPRFALRWMIAGTAGSALAIVLLAVIAERQLPQWLGSIAYVLGLANGAFAVAALGVMMELSSAGRRGEEGLRMGLWGSAQALAFTAGGLCSGAAVDLARRALGSPAAAYALVLSLDAALFIVASVWALRLAGSSGRRVLPFAPEQVADL